MKTWQKIWLYGLIIFASFHYVRDTVQDLGIVNILTTSMVKDGHSMIFKANPLSPFKIYWAIFNTYTIAVIEIVFAITCLYRNKFGKWGTTTLIIGFGFLLVWLLSWIYLK